MERKILRENGSEWCELEIRLQDGRLSICGATGYILPRARAKREARESMASYYDEVSDDERRRLNEKLGCRSANGFARRVAEEDGELAGLDVHKEYCRRVLITSSCGQIREDLQRWFPEAAPLFPWHLNDMRPGCEHQEQAERDGREQYTTGEACEVCGYRHGSAWQTRELPAEIVQLAETVCQDGES
jgi:hypothetical protein